MHFPHPHTPATEPGKAVANNTNGNGRALKPPVQLFSSYLPIPHIPPPVPVIQRVVDTQYPISGLHDENEPDRVFFERGEVTIENTEIPKITTIATSDTEAKLVLTGYASEDEALKKEEDTEESGAKRKLTGEESVKKRAKVEKKDSSDDEEEDVAVDEEEAADPETYDLESLKTIADDRSEAVEHELTMKGHTGEKEKKSANINGMLGRSDYRLMRSVTIEPEEEATVEPETVELVDPSKIEAAKRIYEEALEAAITDVHLAHERLQANHHTYQEALRQYFGTADVAEGVIHNLAALEAQLILMRGAERYKFTTAKDPKAGTGLAKNEGFGAEAIITIRPRFLEKGLPDRLDTLLHEATHGTPDIKSEDYAYMDDRMLDFIINEEKIANADSYVLFVRSLLGKDTIAVRQVAADQYEGFESTPGEQLMAVKYCVAIAEKSLGVTVQDLEGLYDRMSTARTEGWKTGYYFDIAKAASEELKITEPVEGSYPTLNDIVQVRGVANKFRAAKRFISGDVTVRKVTSDSLLSINDDDVFEVNAAFLELSRKDQLKEILIEIFDLYGMTGNGYIFMIQDITEEAGITTPLSD
ncbi:hypothetical protein SAMN04488505_10357 [Chitinophaga rupis]|uniref:Uncharacterized protein n=1 Tax=Chitinophaga rupis TaxID=573321 RepID=A0A1H7UPZ9_9BACT|nr:hypothetical protein [Chitinophaga rupis]SEL98467.1 hypothetical protein SAMN04488505_10357 [Chitinophaga rupis]